MKFTFLGTGSGMAGSGRNFSSNLIETPSGCYIIDAGEGTARQLVRFGVDPEQVDAVLISHMHTDHAAGIFGIIQWMHLCNRTKPLAVYVPTGSLVKLMHLFPVMQINQEKWDFKFDCLPISSGMVLNGDRFQLMAIPNGHLAPHLAYHEQIQEGKDSYSFRLLEPPDRKSVYTSDVPNLNHLNGLSANAKVLISECTHVTMGDIIEFARAHGIPKIMITHIPPINPPSDGFPEKHIADPEVQFANDGDTIEV